MSDNSVTVLMDGAKKVALLTKEEELALAAQLADPDPVKALEARNALVAANIRFVTHLAHGYVKSSETALEDFVSAGLEAMVKNADKFDPSKANFCTFIKPWVKKAFQELRYTDTAIAVPRHRHISINKVHRAMERLALEHPFEHLSDEMIAEAAGMKPEEVRECLTIQSEFLTRTPSLDAPFGEDNDSTLLDTVSEVVPMQEGSDFSQPMQKALAELTADEAQVIMMTAGLDGAGEMTNTEIGETMGITGAEVRALLASARNKMSSVL